MSSISAISQYLPVTPPAAVVGSTRSQPAQSNRESEDSKAKEAAKVQAAKAPGTGTLFDIKA